MSDAPAWAQRLVRQVCDDAGVPLPPLTWRRSRAKWYSSGTTYADRIVVTAGTDSDDRRMVLLHEMAHWLRYRSDDTGCFHHDALFWRIAFDLYARHRVPARHAATRERSVGAQQEAARRQRKAAA